MAVASHSSIIPYLPGALAEWSRSGEVALPLPSLENFEGAFLVIDASGFTRVASRLSRQGGVGVERISEVLTDFFTNLGALVETEGGVVFGFEGDALLAGWRCDGDPLPSSLLRCCGCALAIRGRLKDWRVDDHTLQMRMSIGAGTIQLLHLGHETRRCYLLPAGEAVEQATALVPRTDANEILVSSQAWPLIQTYCEADPHGDGVMRLIRVNANLARAAPREFSDVPLRDLSSYLPRALRTGLRSSLPEWGGELRIVTVAFIKASLTEKKPSSLMDLNCALLSIEHITDDYGGELLEVAKGTDGLDALCVFGLPSGARESIGKRAVLAATQISAALAAQNISVSAGIATGQVFCGPVGPEHRRQYSVVGAPVYLASRISSVAAGRILVDEAIVARTSRFIRFAGPWPLHLAGIRDSVKGYVPLGPANGSERLHALPFINREREIGLLNTLLRQTTRGGTQVVLIEGEPGMGKTALVSAFADKCAQAEVRILEGASDALDQVTPYLAWRAIILQCLDLDVPTRRPPEVPEDVQQRIPKDGALANFAPLLNDVLNLRLPENLITSNMARDVRAENLRRLLVEIVTKRLSGQQNVVIIEDIQWADESSSRLLVEVVRSDPSALVILTCRNLHDFQPLVRALAAGAISYRRLLLRRLSKKHTVDLACKRLNRNQVSDWFAQFIVDTTDGNPLFVDEICHVINQEKRGSAPTDDPIDRDYAAKLPKVLETAVLSRIDHLAIDDQLVAKLASVIGLTFQVDLLTAVAPRGLDVPNSIERMLAYQLLRRLPGNVEAFAFRHHIIRDLVYGSLLTKQKRESHTAIAQLLEADSDSADSVRLPLILHHWRCADDPKKMVAYLDQVAALRLRQFDNATAIKLLNECLAMAREHDIQLENEKRAACHLLLGQAYVGSGRMAGARKSYEIGLALLGQALPKTKLELMASLLWQSLRQCWTRATRPSLCEVREPIPQPEEFRQDFGMAAQAYEDLARIYYLAGDKTRLLHAILKATNLAESHYEGTSALAMYYSTLGAICGVIPMRRQAQHYFHCASKLAKLYNEPNVSSIVHLTEGLYRSSVADWIEAKAHFVAGLDTTKRIGDKRRWCELAISLETICGPWLLTPAFSDVQAWDALLDEIYQIGCDRDDSHVLGCAVLGKLRGNRILGRSSQTRERLKVLTDLLGRETYELELIHRVEGCAHLASIEFAQGNVGAGDEWLRKSEAFLPELNAGIKVRTLPALSFLFQSCMQRVALMSSGKAESRELSLASRVLSKLNRFARIYSIGEPEKLRCEGDLCALTGRDAKAVKLWHSSLKQAVRLKMALAAFQAAERLKHARYDGKLNDPNALSSLLTPFDDWSNHARIIAERAARADGAADYLFPPEVSST